jgi:hypothetical protein
MFHCLISVITDRPKDLYRVFLRMLVRGVVMKKGQGISINVIIIAAIAVLVLVILSVIFLGYFQGWTGNVNDCENKGGTCLSAAQCPSGQVKMTYTCPNEAEICCIPTGG